MYFNEKMYYCTLVEHVSKAVVFNDGGRKEKKKNFF